MAISRYWRRKLKLSRLTIQNFRGIQSTNLLFPDHAVLIGDNNVGKSTIFEALDLVLGPDRLSRKPIIDEHDFFCGHYQTTVNNPPPEIKIEATVTHLNEEQQCRFRDHIEWWNEDTNELMPSSSIAEIDTSLTSHALRITFSGSYNEEEDDFTGATYFSKSEEFGERELFTKRDKQYCGFLYLRSLRTGRRALSLERGSLLDIILRLKEIRPQMWENTINSLSTQEVAGDPAMGISGILESIQSSIKKFVPREWGVDPHLKISNLTRQHLRQVITAFVATGAEGHTAPFYRQGTGTINLLVLALLSQIAEEKQNVIFAMEEPETAIPPYAQKRIIHEIRKLSTQSLFTSHSPYVLEEFAPEETVILSRTFDGYMKQEKVILPEGIKHKTYRQEFRTRFCEALLSRRILIGEGATEASALPAAARKLSELNPFKYSPLEALGICTIDAGSDSKISALGTLYMDLQKHVYAVCDKQEEVNEAKIRKATHKLFMHEEKGFESLVLNNTTEEAIIRFVGLIEWPSHIKHELSPESDPREDLLEYFLRTKGNYGIADFLTLCESEEEIPKWIRQTCMDLKQLCEAEEFDNDLNNEIDNDDDLPF